jgi:hypothetical protein
MKPVKLPISIIYGHTHMEEDPETSQGRPGWTQCRRSKPQDKSHSHEPAILLRTEKSGVNWCLGRRLPERSMDMKAQRH